MTLLQAFGVGWKGHCNRSFGFSLLRILQITGKQTYGHERQELVII